MKVEELLTSARLEGVYGVMRKVQSIHDGFETRCIGSGNCCAIGLRIHLSEAWNIARNLRRVYWITAEDKGTAAAEAWHEDIVARLIATLVDDKANWDPNVEETPGTKCVFYNGGCTIYEYRPLICRAYGVFLPVQDGVCPRKRLSDGGHELIRDESIDRTLAEFDNIIETWGTDNPDLDYSIHIAAGVLRFLIPVEQLVEVIESTDKKFWMGHPGYPHQMHKKDFGTSVTIERKS